MRVRAAGDAALLVQAEGLAGRLAAAILQARIAGVLDVVPGAGTVLIVTEPGAPASVVTAISNAAAQDAGATVTGQIALQPKFFDDSDTTLAGLDQTNLAMAQADCMSA